jgi:two-component system NarL family sensor kinase
LGLPAALELLGGEMTVRTGIKVSVSTRLRSYSISSDHAVESFRISQQALHNVETHAEATLVQLELWEESDELCLRITDNGCGFNVQAMQANKERGIGLSNMRQRVQRLGGSINLRSRPGETAVEVRFPPAPTAA